MPDTPEIHITISLTSPTFRISDSDNDKPHLIVTSTLITPEVLTVSCRGERDAGTVLSTFGEPWFRMENFTFHDLSSPGEPEVPCDLFPGSCEPDLHDFLELRAGVPRVTRMLLHEVDPLSDPVNVLKPGHQYCLRLRPKTVACWIGGLEEMLGRREAMWRSGEEEEGEEEQPPEYGHYRLPDGDEVQLACEEELVLTVEK